MVVTTSSDEQVQHPIMLKDDRLGVRCRHQPITGVAGGHCRKCMQLEEYRLLRNRQNAKERHRRRMSSFENGKSRIEELERKNEELRAKNEGLVNELNALDAPLLLGNLRPGQRGVEDAMLNLALLKRTEDSVQESDAATPPAKLESSDVTASSSNAASSSNGSSVDGPSVSSFHFRSLTNCKSLNSTYISSIFRSVRTSQFPPAASVRKAAASEKSVHVRSTSATFQCCLCTISSAAPSVLLWGWVRGRTLIRASLNAGQRLFKTFSRPAAVHDDAIWIRSSCEALFL